MLRIENYNKLVGETIQTKDGLTFEIVSCYPVNMLQSYAIIFKANSVIVGTDTFELHLNRTPDNNVMPELVGLPIYKIQRFYSSPTNKPWHPFGVTKGIIKDKAQLVIHLEKYVQSCL